MYWQEYGLPSPYRRHKKKLKNNKSGKFFYDYYNEDAPNEYESVEVNKDLMIFLVDCDKEEYSNNRKHDEKWTTFDEQPFDDDDENEDTIKYSNRELINYEKKYWQGVADKIDIDFDRERLIDTFNEEDKNIYSLYFEYNYTQKNIAEELNLSTAYVNRRMKIILRKLIKEDMDYGQFSPSRLDAEVEYKLFIITKTTDSFVDVAVLLYLTQFPQEMILRYLYCMFGTYQLYHYCFIFIYRLKDKLKKIDINRFVKLLPPYSKKLYDRYTKNFRVVFKLLFIFLELKCIDNFKKRRAKEKPANETMIEEVRKTANRCHVSVKELIYERVIPYAQKEAEKRIEQFRKKFKIPKTKPHFTPKTSQNVRIKYRPK